MLLLSEVPVTSIITTPCINSTVTFILSSAGVFNSAVALGWQIPALEL